MTKISFIVELISIEPTNRIVYIPIWMTDGTTRLGKKLSGMVWERPYLWEFSDVPDIGYIEVREHEGEVDGWSGRSTSRSWKSGVFTALNGHQITFDVEAFEAITPTAVIDKEIPWGWLILVGVIVVAMIKGDKKKRG